MARSEEHDSEAVLNLDGIGLEKLVQRSLASMTPPQVTEEIISHAPERIGTMWAEGSAHLAQIFLGSDMCEELLQRILPQEAHRRKDSPVIGTANYDDHHSLVIRKVGRGGRYIRGDNLDEMLFQVPDEVLLALLSTVEVRGNYPLTEA